MEKESVEGDEMKQLKKNIGSKLYHQLTKRHKILMAKTAGIIKLDIKKRSDKMNLKQLEKIAKSPIAVDAVGDYAEFYLKDIVELIAQVVESVPVEEAGIATHIITNDPEEQDDWIDGYNECVQKIKQWKKKVLEELK